MQLDWVAHAPSRAGFGAPAENSQPRSINQMVNGSAPPARGPAGAPGTTREGACATQIRPLNCMVPAERSEGGKAGGAQSKDPVRVPQNVGRETERDPSTPRLSLRSGAPLRM